MKIRLFPGSQSAVVSVSQQIRNKRSSLAQGRDLFAPSAASIIAVIRLPQLDENIVRLYIYTELFLLDITVHEIR